MTRLGILERIERLPPDEAKRNPEYRLHFRGGCTCYTVSDEVMNLVSGEDVYVSSHGVFLVTARSKRSH